jgi:hypothetical protein
MKVIYLLILRKKIKKLIIKFQKKILTYLQVNMKININYLLKIFFYQIKIKIIIIIIN